MDTPSTSRISSNLIKNHAILEPARSWKGKESQNFPLRPLLPLRSKDQGVFAPGEKLMGKTQK